MKNISFTGVITIVGSIVIVLLVGLLVRDKIIVAEDSFEETLELAQQGYAEAQSNLGRMYDNGRGVTQDYKQAVNWFKIAAEQGDAEVQNDLGLMYANGLGVDQDDKQAVNWYTKAAEQGHAKAQFNLGAMYDSGRGVIQDDKQAVIWYKKAAEQGFAYNLGVSYEYGQEVT